MIPLPKRPVPFPRPKPVKPPLPERQRMTIAAGFLCSDGVVLAADTQFTGALKQQGLKIWEITGPELTYTIAMAGAGDAGLIHALRDRLRQLVQPGVLGIRPLEMSALMTAFGIRGSQMSVDTVADDLQSKYLKPFFDEHVLSYPQWQDSRPLQFLLTIRVGQRIQLYMNSAATLGSVDAMACIGSGSDLGGYLQETLFTPNTDMQMGRRIAAHLLKHVKRYSLWCGGDSTIMSIPINGQPSFMTKKEVRRAESWMQRHLKVSLADHLPAEPSE